jgi:hypothetical protein
MNYLGACLLVQLSLAFGMTVLLWPDKLMPLFDVLMFPWAASYRIVRAHSFVALGASLVILIKVLAVGA